MISMTPTAECCVKLTINRQKNVNPILNNYKLKIKINGEEVSALKKTQQCIVYLSKGNYEITLSAFFYVSKTLYIEADSTPITINAAVPNDSFTVKGYVVKDYIGLFIPKTAENKNDRYSVSLDIRYNVPNGTKKRSTNSKIRMRAGDYARIPRDGCEEAIFIIRERTSFKEDNSVSCGDAKINDKGTIIFVADSPEGIFRQYKVRTVADEQEILSQSPNCLEIEKTFMELEAPIIEQERKERAQQYESNIKDEERKKQIVHSCAYGIKEKVAFSSKKEDFFILSDDGRYAISERYKIKDIQNVELMDIPAFSNPLIYTSMGEQLGGKRGREVGAMMALDAKTKLARAEVWITVANQANTDVIKAKIYDPILSFYKNDKDYLKAVQEYNKIVAYIDSYKNSNHNKPQKKSPQVNTLKQTHNSSIKEKLLTLNSLLEDNLITKEEYDNKKRQLLDDM